MLNKNKKIKVNNSLILLFTTIIIILLFIIIGQVSGNNFLSLGNFKTLLRSMTVFGIIAVGLTPLIIARGLDLSFGASLSLSSVVIAILYTRMGFNLWLSLLIGILICVLVGAINGILIVRFRLIPIILTLGIMFILESSALVLATLRSPTTGSSGGAIDIAIGILTDELYWFANNHFLSIPLPTLVFIIIVIIYWFTMDYTRIGARIKAMGGSPEIASLFGIKTNKIMVFLYIFMGLLTGIATIMMISVSGIGAPNLGEGMPLKALSAVLIGGIALTGGTGNIWGTVLGTIIMKKWE